MPRAFPLRSAVWLSVALAPLLLPMSTPAQTVSAPELVWRVEMEAIGVHPLSAVSISPSGVVAVQDPFSGGAAILNPDGRMVGWLAPGEQFSTQRLQWLGDTVIYSLRGDDHYRMAVVDGRRVTMLDATIPKFNSLPAGSPFKSSSIVKLLDGGRSAIIAADMSDERWATDHARGRTVYWHGTPSEPLGRMLFRVPNMPCRGEVVVQGLGNPMCTRLPVVSSWEGQLRFHLLDYDRWDQDNTTFRVMAMTENGDTAYVSERRYVPNPTSPPSSGSGTLSQALAARFPWPPIEPPAFDMVSGIDGEVWLRLAGADGTADEHWLVIDARGRQDRMVALPRGARVWSVTSAGDVMVLNRGAIEKYRLSEK
jgi:hypothetical protein